MEEGSDSDETSWMQASASSAHPLSVVTITLRGTHRILHTLQITEDQSVFSYLEENWPFPSRPHTDMVALHVVDSPPSYIQRSREQLFFIEFGSDRFEQVHEDDVLVLLTIKYFIPGTTWEHDRTRSKVIWCPKTATRDRILTFLRMQWFCERDTIQCELFFNELAWRKEDSAIRHFESGDHLRLNILSRHETWCTFTYSEQTDRQRRIFESSSSEPRQEANVQGDQEQEETEEESLSPYTIRDRSRSRTRSLSLLQKGFTVASTLNANAQPFFPNSSPRPGRNPGNQSEDPQESDLRWGKPHVFDRWCAQPAADHSLGSSVRLCLDDLIEKPVLMNINCATTRELRQQLLDYPIRPDPSMALVVKWHESTLHAMERTPYWIDEPVVRYNFYTDGSSVRLPKTEENESGRKGASAVILIVETPAGPRYGGSLVGSLQDDPTSPQTEIAALTLALTWAIQLGHHHPANGFPFNVAFGFDCTAAGNTAQGSWQINANIQDQWGNRALTQWLQQKHGANAVSWHHIHSHQGHPWNEGADAIAWAAVNGWINAATLDPLRQLIVNPDVYWVWFLEAVMQGHPTLPRLEGDQVVIDVTTPLTNQAHADQQPMCVRQREEAQNGTREEHEVLIRFATANVLTLFAQEDVKGGYVSARQEALLRQFASACAHVIGVQETRSTLEGYQTAEGFHILSAPATQQGVGGAQIWIAKVWNFGSMKMHIKHHHLRILHGTAQRLIVAIQNPGIKLLVVTGHAPPCVEPAISRKWWNATSTAIPKAYQDWPTVYALDANARIGSILTSSVDDCGADDENEAGTEFHSWLLAQQCIAPQTFSKYHSGDHATWTHPKGTVARIDYLVIDAVLQHEELRTWVSEEVDLALTRQDHQCVMMDLPLRICVQDPTGSTSTTGLAAPQDEQGEGPPIPWSLNVHDHAAHLQRKMKAKMCKDEKVQPRKAHLQPTTWAAIQWKKYCWQRCCQVRRTYRTAMLREMFNAWRIGQARSTFYGPWLRLIDTTYAWHLGQVLAWSAWTHAQVRHDDAAYYASFAEKTTAALADEGLKGLWAAIKPVLPKQRTKRKQNIRCRGPTVNEIRDHFNELEAGTIIDYEELLMKCQQAQQMRAVESPICLEFSQIPSRIEMEQRILRQQVHRAPGLDRVPGQVLREVVRTDSSETYALMFKAWVLGSEPLQFKGGLLHMISKKAGGVRAQDMRGIMLLDGIGKAYHGLIRRRVLQWSSPRRMPSQFGGYQRQQTLFATQLLRSLVRTAQQRGLSTTVLFLDVRNAFHGMIREHVFGGSFKLPSKVKTCLQAAGLDSDLVEESTSAYATEFLQTADPCLQRAAQDAHQHTWYTLANHDLCYETQRGSRPGSPLADLAYNTMMQSLLREIQEIMDADVVVHTACAALGLHSAPIAWVDDVAIPLFDCDATTMDSATIRILRKIDAVFQRHGLCLNYSAGKTEAVIQYRGQSAPAMRQHRFIENLGRLPISEQADLRTVSEYHYLGTTFSQAVAIDQELRVRLAKAGAAFRVLRKPIFMNRKLPIPTKLILLDSMVTSILLHGAGNWPLLSVRQHGKIHATMMKWYRSIIGTGFWSDERVSDVEIMAKWHIPPLAVRLTTEATVAWIHSHLHRGASQVRSAVRRYLLQQQLAYEVLDGHRRIWDVCKKAGRDLRSSQEPTEDMPVGRYPCQFCAKVFSNAQALQGHVWSWHHKCSDERLYVFSDTCPICQVCYWTPQRMQQHLKATRHQPNGCYEQLVRFYEPLPEPLTFEKPTELARFHRLPRCRVEGPKNQQQQPIWRKRQSAKLDEYDAQWEAYGYPTSLCPHYMETQRKAYVEITEKWFSKGDYDMEDLIEQWHYQSADQHDHCTAIMAFFYWGRYHMTDVLDGWDVPDAIEAAHDGFQEVACAIPIWQLWCERDGVYNWREPSVPTPLQPEQRIAATRGDREIIPDSLQEQNSLIASYAQAWAAPTNERRKVPIYETNEGDRYIVILHLFAGRRRPNDCGHWATELGHHYFHRYGLKVMMLAVDTAVDDTLGNLDFGSSFTSMMELSAQGVFALSLGGPPCETWSSARHLELEQSNGRSGPRPLRSQRHAWGIRFLTARELKQAIMGNRLMLNELTLEAAIINAGGDTLMEHPEEPIDPSFASVWRIGLHRNLLPSLANMVSHHVQQWRHGASAVKPTRIRTLGMVRSYHIFKKNETQGVSRPVTHLGGLDHMGKFKTASAKEYPGDFCRALVDVALNNISLRLVREGQSVVQERMLSVQNRTWLNQMWMPSTEINPHAVWRPDYQPH